MFTFIKCRFHSSYGLRCERTYYIRIAFRHDFFPSSLIVFFVIREESHHSFNRSMTSTIFRTKKKKKKKKRVIIEIIAILFLFIYFFFSFYDVGFTIYGVLWKTSGNIGEKRNISTVLSFYINIFYVYFYNSKNNPQLPRLHFPLQINNSMP